MSRTPLIVTVVLGAGVLIFFQALIAAWQDTATMPAASALRVRIDPDTGRIEPPDEAARSAARRHTATASRRITKARPNDADLPATHNTYPRPGPAGGVLVKPREHSGTWVHIDTQGRLRPGQVQHE